MNNMINPFTDKYWNFDHGIHQTSKAYILWQNKYNNEKIDTDIETELDNIGMHFRDKESVLEWLGHHPIIVDLSVKYPDVILKMVCVIPGKNGAFANKYIFENIYENGKVTYIDFENVVCTIKKYTLYD